MKVVLLRPLPDPRRWSMGLYYEQLAAHLGRLKKPADEFRIFPPASETHRWDADLDRWQGKWTRYYQQYLRYAWEATKLQPDLFHITDHAYAHLIPSLKYRKIVVTVHDTLLPRLEAGTLPVSWKPGLAIQAQKRCLQRLPQAGGVITVSEFTKKELLHFSSVSEARIKVIPNGVHPEFFERAPDDQRREFRRRWSLEGKQILFLTGRVDPHKNVEGALWLFHHYGKKIPDHKLVLVKAGSPLNAPQRSLARNLGIDLRVIDAGDLSLREMRVAYQESHVVLIPSFYEGFGLPAIEAMASGVPVLAASCASLPEVVGDAGILWDPASPEAGAEALHRLVTDLKCRQDIIDKGKERAGRFTWEAAARKTFDFYLEVLKKR